MKQAKSLIMIIGTISFIYLFLIAINQLLLRNKIKQFNVLQKLEVYELQKFCKNINFSDSKLNLIFKLEQRKKEILKYDSKNPYIFPDICETALNELRVIDAPELAREGQTIEAIRILCKVPADSEFLIDAKIWINRWYHSSYWGKETKIYLKEISNCPPRNKLDISNNKHI